MPQQLDFVRGALARQLHQPAGFGFVQFAVEITAA